VSQATLVNWKKTLRFRQAWERKLAEMNVSPERTQGIMDAAYVQALKGNVKAMELYMRLVDKISPNRVVVEDKRGMAELSDEELADRARRMTSNLTVLEGGASG
jgi:hypothetical protein